MTTKHSKDHWRTTASGKVVHVAGHDYVVEDTDAEFNAIFGKVEEPAAPAPAPEPQPKDPELEAEFEAIFGDTAAAPAPPKPPDPKPDYSDSSQGIKAWTGKHHPDVEYGGCVAVFVKAGVKNTVQITLPPDIKAHAGEIVQDLKELGLQAKWMPIKHKLMVTLPGTPNASGKADAHMLHGYMKTLGGKAAPDAAPTPKTVTPTPVVVTATSSQAKAGTMNGWKQIGPQKGSNPGGLYQDAYGKKWYVKFPASEDRAKNELLASKLYKYAGLAVPSLKLVNDGKRVGIASAWQEGLQQSAKALKAAPGGKEGFGVDAWLANWDAAGLTNDNMLIAPNGHAVRVDVGGALLYRAQGTPKGDAFGNVVNEIHTLVDPAANPNTAAIFKGMSRDEINQAMAKVLEIPDDEIKAAVMKWGPGGAKEKEALAAKLVARKAYLAKQYPDANAIANPPKPDPRNLKVNASLLPKQPNFLNWNGQGKGLSSSEAVNKANQKDVEAIYEAASKGNLPGLQGYQYEVVDKATGAVLGTKPIGEHPSQHVQAYWAECASFLEVIANPSAKKQKSYAAEDTEDIDSLSEAFPNRPPGTTVAAIPADERLGWWMTLGVVESVEELRPKNLKNVTPDLKLKVKQQYAKMTEGLKSWLKNVQSSGSSNFGNKGLTPQQKQLVKESYTHAVEFPEGTITRRWLELQQDMVPLMANAPVGLVFENPRSTCSSMRADWGEHPHFGGAAKNGALLEIHYAKGAKGLPTAGSGGYASEEEITTLPGQRYMVLEKKKHPSGKPHYVLLALPPDPTYVEALQ